MLPSYPTHLSRCCARAGLPFVWLEPIFPQPAEPLAHGMPTNSANEADIGPWVA